MLDTTTIGRALHDTRELAGLRPRAAARALGVTPSDLRAWECARAIPAVAVLDRATLLYAQGLDGALAPRVPLIDPGRPGYLVVGDELVPAAPTANPLGDPRAANRDLLGRYVTAVRRQRGLAPHDAVELRHEDVTALARHLDVRDDELQTLLTDTLSVSAQRAVAVQRALLLGALVAVVATGAVPDAWIRSDPFPPAERRRIATTWTAVPPELAVPAVDGTPTELFSPWFPRTPSNPAGAPAMRPAGAASPSIPSTFSVDATERRTTVPPKPFSEEPSDRERRPTFAPRQSRSTFDPRAGVLFSAAELPAGDTRVHGERLALPPTR